MALSLDPRTNIQKLAKNSKIFFFHIFENLKERAMIDSANERSYKVLSEYYII